MSEVKTNPWQMLTVVLGILLAVSVFTGGFGTGANTVVAENNRASQAAAGPSPTANVNADGDPLLGSADAPVEIVVFSDFQCPFCARAVPTVKQIIDEYGDSVSMVFRDFPLSFHQNAQKAAEAAECANEQGMFWEYHDALFANQGSLDIASLKNYATQVGLDTEQFSTCLDSGKYAQEVQQDFSDGVSLGVTGTPTFFINGKKLVGAQPFSEFKTVIDQELGG